MLVFIFEDKIIYNDKMSIYYFSIPLLLFLLKYSDNLQELPRPRFYPEVIYLSSSVWKEPTEVSSL